MYSSPLKHFNKLETRNLSKTGMQSFQKADNPTFVVYSLETLQSSHPQPPQFFSTPNPCLERQDKIMENTNANTQYPSPARERRSTGCLWGTIVLLTVALCMICGPLFLVGMYYSSEIVSGISELVDIVTRDPIDVVPEGGSTNDNETDTDTDPLPRNGTEELDPTFHAFTYLPEGACVFTGGVTKPWSNGPANLNYAGIINQSTQESGFSMQAYLEHWTDRNVVVDYEYPKGKVEAGNDGGIQLEVCNISGQLYVFMPDRTGESKVPFHQVSFTQLVGKELLVCKNDTGKPGDWNGYCDEPFTYVIGIPIEDFVIPGDLIFAWSKMEDVLYDLPGNYRLPAYGEMLSFWINPK